MSDGMKTSLSRWGVPLLMLLVGAAMLSLSRMDVLVAGGSDSLVAIFRPPYWAQLLALILLPVSSFVALRPGRGRWNWAGRAVLLPVALFAYVLSLHAVSLDSRDTSVHDIWGIWTVRRLIVEDEGFLRTDFSLKSASLLSVQGDHGQSLEIFLGIPPWNIDGKSILSYPALLPVESPELDEP